MTEPIQPNDYTSVIEVYTDPISVLQVETRGPQGRPGVKGDPGPRGPGPDFQGTWSPDTRYDTDDYVSYQQGMYLTNGNAEVGVPPFVDGALSSGWFYFTKPGPKGEDGDPGPAGPPGVRFYDEFDPDHVYLPGDIVTYNGALYASTHTSVEGALPTDPSYWKKISYGGDGGGTVSPKFTALVPQGTAVEIAHNLGTEYVRVTVRDRATKEVVYPGVNILDPDHIELTFGYLSSNPVDGTFHATVERDA